jgi:type I restriction enzyme M protein
VASLRCGPPGRATRPRATPNTQDTVQKLWNLCHILRGDGITYHEYVTELTFPLFLKMMKETGAEDQIPKGYRWDDVTKMDGVEQLDVYKKLLVDLGSKGSGRVQAIFANASTSFRQPRHLRSIVDSIDGLDWYSAKSEGLGDLYEGLLEKNAEETKSGAGQYFTPRPLIEAMVALLKPQPGERLQDPAVGTGGFLINAARYMRSLSDDYHDLPLAKQNFQRREAFYGVDLVPDVQRLALMNAMLHDIEGDTGLRRGRHREPDPPRDPTHLHHARSPRGRSKGRGREDHPQRCRHHHRPLHALGLGAALPGGVGGSKNVAAVPHKRRNPQLSPGVRGWRRRELKPGPIAAMRLF